MPDNGVEAAQARVEAAQARVEAAQARVEAAQAQVSKAQAQVSKAQARVSEIEKRFQIAAIKGAGWKIFEFFVQNMTAWVTLWYSLVSIIGMAYIWGFYDQFSDKGIGIFYFFGIPDFLLSAFRNIKMLIIGVLATLISIGILVLLAYTSIKFGSNPALRDERVGWTSWILLSVFLVGVTFLIPFLWGMADSKAALEKESRHVKITLRRGTSQAEIPPLGRTLFLGTTSDFHFFYECKNIQKCANGWPFIIPTANIASLEFEPLPDSRNGEPQNGEKPEDGSSDAVAAIKTHDANSKENKEEIIKAIKGLRPRDVSPPDSGEIATAINTLNETVHNLPISVGENHCASRWKEVANIQPFCRGEYNRLEEATKKCSDQSIPPGQRVIPDQFVKKIKTHFNGKTPQHLMLVGRVDNTLFSEEKREFYGTQMKLARVRAEWVRGEILKEFPTQIDPQQITLRAAGPRYVKDEATEINRAKDRTVEVYACWTPKDSE